MYGYNLSGGQELSVYFPLRRVGTQSEFRNLGTIKLYNKVLPILEMVVTVTLGADGASTLELDEMHTVEGGCGDWTTNDCVTNVPESEYPMWAVCKPFNFVLTPPGLTLEMKIESKFLVVSVAGEIVGKVTLPPLGCHANAPRNTITRISYVAESSLAQPFICN